MKERLDELKVNVRVGITVIPIAFLRSFNGTGKGRKREVHATREVAERLAKHISYVHAFYEEGRSIEKEELADFLFEHLTGTPDDTVRGLTVRNVDSYEAALNEVVDALVSALAANWSIRYEPSQPALPGQGVKWHS